MINKNKIKNFFKNQWVIRVGSGLIVYLIISLLTSLFQNINLLFAFKRVFQAILSFMNYYVKVWHLVVGFIIYLMIRLFRVKKESSGMEDNKEVIDEIYNEARNLKYIEDDDSNIDLLLNRVDMIIRKTFGEKSPYLDKLDKIEFPEPLEVPEKFDMVTASKHENDWSSAQQKVVNLIKVMKEEIESR